MSAPEPVPDPAVPPEAYDEAYYRETCAGYEEWTASGGRDADPLYAGVLTLADLRPGEVAVDVGTGRGEVRRVLRPGGRLFVHTMPNRLVYDGFVPAAHRGVYRWLASHRPTRALGVADLFATAHRPT